MENTDVEITDGEYITLQKPTGSKSKTTGEQTSSNEGKKDPAGESQKQLKVTPAGDISMPDHPTVVDANSVDSSQHHLDVNMDVNIDFYTSDYFANTDTTATGSSHRDVEIPMLNLLVII